MTDDIRQTKPGSAASHSEHAPFQQVRFEHIPDKPTKPHRFYELQQRALSMHAGVYGGLKVAYRTHGSGPPLLLIHGLMTTSYSWRYVLEPLGEHYTLYMPDLPGAGLSGYPESGDYGAESLATWITDFQSELGIHGCRVVGNSMGGYLTMIAALADPQSMSHLVNLHSPGLPEARFYALQAASSIPGVKRVLRYAIQRDPLRWAHKQVHYYDESLKSMEEAREYGEPLRSDAGCDGFIGHLFQTMRPGAMVRLKKRLQELRKRGEEFPVPLRLIYARQDPIVPPALGARFQELIPGSELVWLEKGSHFAHVDAVEDFVRQVLQFLR